jgi:hypothetical protein
MPIPISDLVQRCLQPNDDVIIQVEGLNEVAAELTQALSDRGVFVTTLDRAPIYNWDTMIHAFYQNCEFPGYFGFNSNALLDCLTDFEWRPAKGYVLIYQDPSLLQTQDPQTWAELSVVLHYAGERWTRWAKPFKVLVPATRA